MFSPRVGRGHQIDVYLFGDNGLQLVAANHSLQAQFQAVEGVPVGPKLESQSEFVFLCQGEAGGIVMNGD